MKGLAEVVVTGVPVQVYKFTVHGLLFELLELFCLSAIKDSFESLYLIVYFQNSSACVQSVHGNVHTE
ncbi:hypothetical protein [Candidatus Anaplasma sp. TIGMIC]|uniref:hypothetical protein n=1 Tax=Candidatus Anaplasma sp. TIGMIC TaxID=3020713 RepID=UPI00232F40E9|nr:hypothetical protein [Candidatus Anaplasma sp. TIGMIC]MDB1135376.1 hypothetical protein [Candidatus Anaplasma sp. TIGMIC]